MGEMREKSDIQLLRDYASRHDEAAFREIVTRHTDFVYSAALRQVQSSDLAADITQGVFVDLARKAKDVSERLSATGSIAGWLHRSTRYAVLNHLRDTRRRTTNERQAMEQLLTNSDASVDWEQIRPALDEALDSLCDEDHEALLLRYFKNQNLRSIGLVLGVSDDAAQKRVSRAVDRLREFFARRGVTIGASGLVVVISANAVQAAPVGLAFTISTAAAALTGTTLATATATVTKAIAMTTLQKTLVTATVAGLTGFGIYEARQTVQLRERNQTLQQQQAPMAEQIHQLQSERDEAANQLAALREENDRLNRNTAELLKLRGENARLRNETLAARPNKADASIDVAAKSWLARVSNLKQRLAQTPDANIPELQFLTEEDWLGAASNVLETDVEYRRALSSLRQRARNKVAPVMLEALKQYAETQNGEFPSDLSQLMPFFKSPLDGSILERYEILPMKNLPVSLRGSMAIAEKGPVDADYDRRLIVGEDGYVFSDFRTYPIDERLWGVFRKFSTDNPGPLPTDPSQLLPYATTIDQKAALQSMFEAFEAYKRDHSGQPPDESSDMEPYLKAANISVP